MSITDAQAIVPLARPIPEARPSLPDRRGFLYRLSKHPLFMPYNRLAILVIGINLMLFLSTYGRSSSLVLWLVLANFATAILIRQQDVINLLFGLATRAPHSWPLSVRWALGKVYHFGGIHVGTFFSGTLWLAALTVNHDTPNGLLPLLIVHLLVLSVMIVMALPRIRARWHNAFEMTARFGGWLSLLLFWAQMFFFLRPEEVLASPQAWLLGFLTFCVALPWLRLRKVPVRVLTPSPHVALAHFEYGITPFAGSSTDLSRSPLFEWHAFANVPTPGRDGFRLTISRAGDWTGAFIDDKPEYIWVKGIPTAGVGNIELLFDRVIWVATGSGIGPCLPHLLTKKVPSLLIWSTRNPRRTYGDELVDEILAVQPDARIWDTDSWGKPDLVEMACQAWRDFDAEAVICISNKKVTWNVVYELESRGIPAFGAIWDS